MAAASAALLTGLLWIAGLRGEQYAQLATQNLQREHRLSAPRGRIFDRNGRILAHSVRAWSVWYRPGKATAAERTALVEQLLALGGGDLAQAAPLAERAAAVGRIRILRNTTHDVVVPFLENPDAWPGVTVSSDYRREYPYGAATAQVVGYVGPIPEGAASTYPKDRYDADDEVGRSGIESRFEKNLAGFPGVERAIRDASGRFLDVPETLEEATAGQDAHLTLDAEWQQAALALLQESTGSIVLLSVPDGEVLTAVSWPSYDPVRPGATQIDGRPQSQLFRATRGLYPPGSTFKVVSAFAALAEGLDSREEIHCAGSVRIAGWGRAFHCNVRTGHGPLVLERSIQYSCNVYFYELAKRLGFSPLDRMGAAFGFGERSGCDFSNEPDGQRRSRTTEPNEGELLNLYIGQGAQLSTPLQVARAYVGLAAGGRLPAPSAVRHWMAGERQLPPERGAGKALALPREHRALVVEGMFRVVNATGGTANRSGFDPDWEVCGKTGTAENATGGVDAWFAGFWPRTEPRYALVVHLEGAPGHGGEIAAPIARDFIAFVESRQ